MSLFDNARWTKRKEEEEEYNLLEWGRMRPPSELPALDPTRDYGAWCDTKHVLGYTARGDAYVAYAEVWPIKEGETEPEFAPRWKLAGRDGYDFEGMVGWIPLPPTPGLPKPKGT